MASTDRLKAALSDRYDIEREIGTGGMATVYLARDLKHDRDVALKVLRSDLSAVIGTERFLSEVRITARLDHPHILTLIDSGEADGILYYVLPYVRGESLRAKLNRERQLGVDEALSIVRQVASALDYAHEQGVVHRDIKPENILLHEGVAVLTDFGIALAVKEAGGNRLTETGISLGTPQYMSPEQATGDRALDKRSDIYSLAAVFYEMLAGEPPVTGVTAQAMIAKLLTERPVKLRVVRNTVPVEMETATDKALSKVPADRFRSAGEFVRALSTARSTVAPPTLARTKRRWIVVGLATAGVISVVVWIVTNGSPRSARVPVSLTNRTQLTTTGQVTYPEISDDGKTIAYVVTDCTIEGCRYSVEMQDVAGGPSRRVLEGATAIYGIEMSPDRRHLAVVGSISGKFGAWIVSSLGGAPRYVVEGEAQFFAGGDSLLLVRYTPPADVFWLIVSGLDGVPVDSIRVEGPGDFLHEVEALPDSPRILYALARNGTTEWFSSDRSGERYDSITLPASTRTQGDLSADALWVTIAQPGAAHRQIVRFSYDSATGSLGERGDTLYRGTATDFGVTADGGTLVLDEGTSEYTAWRVSLEDVVSGRLTDEKRLFASTSFTALTLSPDGSMMAIARDVGTGSAVRHWSVRPYASGAETAIPGRHLVVDFLDSGTLEVMDAVPSGFESYVLDYRTRQRRSLLRLNTRALASTRIGDHSWAWIPPGGTTLRVQRDGERTPREFRIPRWYSEIFSMDVSPSGTHIAYVGWKAPAEDSIGLGILSLADGRMTHVLSWFGEGGYAKWLDDSSLEFALRDTQESQTFYRVGLEGSIERQGSTPKPTPELAISRDLKRMLLLTRDHRGDVWMSKVVR